MQTCCALNITCTDEWCRANSVSLPLQICNAVAVARLLNATLVLPQFLVSSVWKDDRYVFVRPRVLLHVEKMWMETTVGGCEMKEPVVIGKRLVLLPERGPDSGRSVSPEVLVKNVAGPHFASLQLKRKVNWSVSGKVDQLSVFEVRRGRESDSNNTVLADLCVGLSSQFGDIYEKDFFMNYLKDDVLIISELPPELQSLDLAVMGSIVSAVQKP